MSSADVPFLTSGNTILNELERRILTKENINSVLTAPVEVMRLCETIFPEVVESNQIGKQDPNKIPADNVVTVEEDTDHWGTGTSEESADVYVGGPAALCAAVIQAKSGHGQTVLYAHDDQRGYSNWKGSASHFHIRDAFPVYYWPDNHGLYCCWVTLKHAIQRRLNASEYVDEVKSDPNWNKFRLSCAGVLRDLRVLGLFAENQLRAFNDVGLHIRGTRLYNLEETTAYITTHHSHLTHSIIPHLESDVPLMLKSNDLGRTIHLELGVSKSTNAMEINEVFKSVADDVDPYMEHIPLGKEKLRERGYDTDFVKQAFEFPRDGYFTPCVGEVLENIIVEGGGELRSNWRLKKILCKRLSGDEAIASRVVWEKTDTGETFETKVNSLYLSLGPSASLKSVDSNKDFYGYDVSSVDFLKQTAKAAGSTIVWVAKVDKSVVPENTLRKFRDHIGSHNKHFVRLGEREVIIDGKSFQFFLQQATGGGHFPNWDVHPETALNVFNANVIPLFGLNAPGIEYDIITVRSCARSVTAQNAFQITSPLANVVAIYGLGGIGMTTMFPNALLMKAVMKLRGELARNEMTKAEFENRIATGAFGSIPHWSAPNPFARNYSRFIDSSRSIKNLFLRHHPQDLGDRIARHSSIFTRMLRFLK